MASEPVRVMASASQAVKHLDEYYENGEPDRWDNAYAIVDFTSGVRAMLELCMFAEGSRYEQELTAVGPIGKIECHVPGPVRFWPEALGAPPKARIITSVGHEGHAIEGHEVQQTAGPVMQIVEVDATLLKAGDHSGSTFYQHEKFQQMVLGNQLPEVTLQDG